MTWREVALILNDARRDLTRAFAVGCDSQVRALIMTTLTALDDVQDCVAAKDQEERI